MTIEFTPPMVYMSILGLLHGYFFFALTIFLARPLAELACEPAKAGISRLSRNITHAMAIAFLISVFFSLSLVWLVLFAAGNSEGMREYFRPWALFWFVGIILYCVVIRAGRPRASERT